MLLGRLEQIGHESDRQRHVDALDSLQRRRLIDPDHGAGSIEKSARRYYHLPMPLRR